MGKNYVFTSENLFRDISPKIFRNIDSKAFIIRNSPAPIRDIMSSKISKNKKSKYLQFINENFNTLSQRGIAKKLSLGKTTVNRWSEEIGLKFKKHTVNTNFFDKLNEESAYILGLIFADGNVSWNPKKGYYTMTITASEKDKEHLEKIRNIISSTKPLLYTTKTKSYRLIVNDKTICQRLMSFGVIPKKSLVVKFPNIPQNYLKHVIRGIIDGDGCIRYCNRKRSPFFDIMICSGSLEFCKKLVTTVKNSIGIDANIRKRANNVYIVLYSCSRAKKLAKYIYSDATIFLDRKYLIYKKNVLEEN